MKKNILLYSVTGGLYVLFILLSLYMNLIAKSANGFLFLLNSQIILSIALSIFILYFGNIVFKDKKNHFILFLATLSLLASSAFVILNYSVGYAKLVNQSNYTDYMNFAHFELSIFLYLLYVLVVGLLCLNSYINSKLKNKEK